MVLPASGPLSFEQIEEEFGQIPGQNNRRLGSYRVNTTFSDITLPLDTTAGADNNTPIPTSGPIAFSDFRNARLNIVVNCYDSDSPEYTTDVKLEKYNDGQATVVGPGDINPLPANTSGKRIIIHVNKKFGSQHWDDVNEQKYCALKTGTWTANTKLQIDVGGSGKIMGAGGMGGGSGELGRHGTSGLGIEHEGTVVNVLAGGAIIAGWGGGTGGSQGVQKDWWNTRRADGGGGGGGAGLPVGAGGPSGGEGAQGGQPGSEPIGGEQGGVGGAGGDNAGEARGGTGGHGSDQTRAGGGINGAAIRRSTASISWSFGDAHITDNVWGDGKDGAAESGTGVA
tara:strand:- start:65 stop:1084 length:1020 start_codon:yes stop_codon:yes gene_type:complete